MQTGRARRHRHSEAPARKRGHLLFERFHFPALGQMPGEHDLPQSFGFFNADRGSGMGNDLIHA